MHANLVSCMPSTMDKRLGGDGGHGVQVSRCAGVQMQAEEGCRMKAPALRSTRSVMRMCLQDVYIKHNKGRKADKTKATDNGKLSLLNTN